MFIQSSEHDKANNGLLQREVMRIKLLRDEIKQDLVKYGYTSLEAESMIKFYGLPRTVVCSKGILSSGYFADKMELFFTYGGRTI